MSKKILINEHAAEASEFIGKIETKLVSALRFTQDRIKALGLEPVTKQELFEIVSGNFEDIKSRYWQANFKDVEHYQSVAAREHTRGIIEEKFTEFRKTTSLKFSETIDNRPISDQTFLSLIDVDETGKPVIHEKTKEALRESFREYLSNPEHIKLHETQQKAAKALEQFAEALRENGLRPYFPKELLSAFEIMTDTEGRWLFMCNSIQYNHSVEV